MATPQEFPAPPCEKQLVGAYEVCMPPLAAQCEMAGELSSPIYAAVAAYARGHLVQQIDNYTGYSSKRIEVSRGDEPEAAPDGFVTRIIVWPRTKGGQLELLQQENFHGATSWGASIDYCLHVSVVGGTTTVVIEQVMQLIG